LGSSRNRTIAHTDAATFQNTADSVHGIAAKIWAAIIRQIRSLAAAIRLASATYDEGRALENDCPHRHRKRPEPRTKQCTQPGDLPRHLAMVTRTPRRLSGQDTKHKPITTDASEPHSLTCAGSAPQSVRPPATRRPRLKSYGTAIPSETQ
jgi:hypothetical protein